MKEIPLTRGMVARVDDDVFDYLMRFKWCAAKGRHTWYAARGTEIAYQCRTIFMHRIIMDAPDGMQVDHIDGNGLNNIRANLRLCHRDENNRNLPIPSHNTSGFKGVFRVNRRWRAVIQANGERWHLGYFDTAEEAARAYDAAAIIHHGEFARLNFKG